LGPDSAVASEELEGLSGEELASYLLRARRVATVSLALKAGIIVAAGLALASGSYVWVFAGLFALAFSFVPTVLRRNYRISIPWILELLIFLALFLHVIGGVFDLYDRIDRWDTMTHFVSTFMLAIVGLTIIYVMHVYWEGLTMDIRAIMVFTVFIGAFLGVTWEVMEWSADQMFGTTEQHGLNDTMKDLVMDMIGAMLAAVLGAKWIVDGTLRRMTADFGRSLNELVFGQLGTELAETKKGGKGG
jgi:VanZ family protein